jgi:hypothetical protein
MSRKIRVLACSILIIVAPLLICGFGLFITIRGDSSDNAAGIGYAILSVLTGAAFVALLPVRPALKVFLAVLSVPVNLALMMILEFYISCSIFHSCP